MYQIKVKKILYLTSPYSYSGKWDSNPQPSAPKADNLPIDLFPVNKSNIKNLSDQ